MTPTEIAAALFAAPHLNEEALADFDAYRYAKRKTGAPVGLETAVFVAAYKCQRVAEELREHLVKAAKEATDAIAGVDSAGTKFGGVWFTLDGRENAEGIAKRLRVARENFNALLDVWQNTADRVVATPEETAAKVAEEDAKRAHVVEAARLAWLKLDATNLAAEAVRRGLAGDGRKTDIASRLAEAGYKR